MSNDVDDELVAPRPRRLRFWRRRQQSDRRPFPFELRKALFILPNAFTVASIFCGFLAIMLAARGNIPAAVVEIAPSENFFVRLLQSRGAEAFDRAGIALIFAAFFDAFDGRIARLTRTQSDFGVQMDSLADVISFGVAPAVLVYNWALWPLGLSGIIASFAFCACGTIRLARFNVLAARGVGSSKYFVGLPIPGASSMLIAVVMTQSWGIGSSVEQTTSVLALVIILSYLMVSRIRFRTFKDFRPRMKTLPIVVVIVVAVVVGFLVFKARLALAVIVGCYVAAGLIEEVLFFKRRRAEAPPAPPTPPAPSLS